MDRRRLTAVALGMLVVCNCAAQDAERGRRLFMDTRGATAKPVGNCVACHANVDALREMIVNRGVKPTDPRSVRVLLQKAIEGSIPGAVNPKAQYRGVLTTKDLDDLAAWIALARAS